MTIGSIVILGGCAGHKSSDHNHNHDHNHTQISEPHADHDHDHDAGNVDEIVFSREQAMRSGVRTGEVRRGRFRDAIKCSGTVSVAPSGVAILSAPVEGIVTYADANVSPDVDVRKGQLLFNISSGQLASGDAVERSRIEFRLAQENFQRIENLYKDKLVTREAYLSAEAEYLKAKNQYEPLRNSGNNGVGVRSTASGYLSQVYVQPGDYVEVGQQLAAVATSDRMQLRAMVSQRYLDRLSDITDASLRPSGGERYTPLSALNGKFVSIGRRVEQGSLLLPVVFEFNGGGRFPDGMYADVMLTGAERTDVVTVPLSALTEQQGLFYVYQQIDDDCYRRVQVWTGADDGTDIEILKGLEGGETIVVEGAVNVRMASASGAIPHGHNH